MTEHTPAATNTEHGGGLGHATTAHEPSVATYVLGCVGRTLEAAQSVVALCVGPATALDTANVAPVIALAMVKRRPAGLEGAATWL